MRASHLLIRSQPRNPSLTPATLMLEAAVEITLTPPVSESESSVTWDNSTEWPGVKSLILSHSGSHWTGVTMSDIIAAEYWVSQCGGRGGWEWGGKCPTLCHTSSPATTASQHRSVINHEPAAARIYFSSKLSMYANKIQFQLQSAGSALQYWPTIPALPVLLTIKDTFSPWAVPLLPL